MRRWNQLAEEKGLLLLAPSLESTRITLSADTDRQITRLRGDEAHILAALNHVRAGYTVSPDRIFIHGVARGAHAALYTGLRNPGIFRTVSIADPKFDSACLESEVTVDPYQSIFVGFATSDIITGKHGRNAVDWLRSVAADVHEASAGYTTGRAERRTVDFIEDALRNHPWIQIHAVPIGPDQPLVVRFTVRASFRPAAHDWRFDNGDRSPVPQPTHTYTAVGRFPLTLTLRDPNGRSFQRAATITLPGAHVQSALATDPSDK
ncbi:MAG: PKD domain-containing protein [Phycisphaerae bacterium]